jgi:hypothetical protein
MNVHWETIYSEDPLFIEPATNQEALLTFMNYKWSNNADIDWSYRPDAGFNQEWPLPENLAYTNEKYKTAAMGGFPLGDLNWFPDVKPAWEAQRDQEWEIINNWLNYGTPNPVSVREIAGKIPTEYSLKQNYPNPFNPTTNIEYSVPKEGYVSIKIFNMLGQQIATLFEGNQKAGNYSVTFDASNLPSGVYVYRLETDNITLTKKLMLMK